MSAKPKGRLDVICLSTNIGALMEMNLYVQTILAYPKTIWGYHKRFDLNHSIV